MTEERERKMEVPYIGKDGREYYDIESLVQANMDFDKYPSGFEGKGDYVSGLKVVTGYESFGTAGANTKILFKQGESN